MLMRERAVLLAALLLAGCASAGGKADAGPVAVDPVGSYTLTTVIQGTPVDGRMRIRGEPGAYGGAVYTDFTGELPIRSISVTGNDVLLTLDTADGTAEVQLTFDGDAFTGTWILGAEGGSIQGRRLNR